MSDQVTVFLVIVFGAVCALLILSECDQNKNAMKHIADLKMHQEQPQPSPEKKDKNENQNR